MFQKKEDKMVENIENKISHISDYRKTNELISPLEMYRSVVRDIENGSIAPTSAAALFCEEREDFKFSFYASKIKMTELISLCELGINRAIKLMGQ
jgi:hypothetical protein